MKHKLTSETFLMTWRIIFFHVARKLWWARCYKQNLILKIRNNYLRTNKTVYRVVDIISSFYLYFINIFQMNYKLLICCTFWVNNLPFWLWLHDRWWSFSSISWDYSDSYQNMYCIEYIVNCCFWFEDWLRKRNS